MQLTLNAREVKIVTQLVKDREDAQRRLQDAVNIIAASHDLPEDWEALGYHLAEQTDRSVAFVLPAPPPITEEPPTEVQE